MTLKSEICVAQLVFKIIWTKYMEFLPSIFFLLHVHNCSVTNTTSSIRSWKSSPHSPASALQAAPTPNVCPFVFLTHQTNVGDDNRVMTTLATRTLDRWTGCRWMAVHRKETAFSTGSPPSSDFFPLP